MAVAMRLLGSDAQDARRSPPSADGMRDHHVRRQVHMPTQALDRSREADRRQESVDGSVEDR